MIIDTLQHAGLYHGLGPRLRLALEFLAGEDFSTFSPGRVELDGQNVFALLQEYETRPRQDDPEDGIWEAHRRYIDVQYIAAGIETMGFAPLDQLLESQPYSLEKDCIFLTGRGDWITMRRGMFAVFFPRDAHRPGLAFAKPATVRKVVVKVALDNPECEA